MTLSEQQTVSRQEAVSKLFAIADDNPVRMPSGCKFNRDECYDE
jgi:hypothetical protein